MRHLRGWPLVCAISLAGTAGACAGKSAGAHPDGGEADAAGNDRGDAPGRHVQTFPATVNRDIDMLYVIDDGPAMAGLQQKLMANFQVVAQVLQGLPGGLPNLHIGVVSGDLGAGGAAGVPGCRAGGDRAILRASSCAGIPDRFLSNVGGVANYPGMLQDAFSCFAAVGEAGCAFNQPLAAALAALGPGHPTENDGFLRPDAYLSIVVLSNQDDCSVPASATLFDPASQTVTDPLGPLTHYRCNEYGHLCQIGAALAPPPRTTAAAGLTGCVPNESGMLTKVAGLVQGIMSLKADPAKVLVSAIAGPPEPYAVDIVQGSNGAQPVVAHSCAQSSTESGDPAVRTAAWVQKFGSNGIFLPVCAASFAPAVQRIAEAVGKVVGPACVEGVLADADSSSPGVQPDCLVSQLVPDSQGAVVETPIAACADDPSAVPCWSLATDAMSCPDAHVLAVNAGPPTPTPAPGLAYKVACAVCTPGLADPRCP